MVTRFSRSICIFPRDDQAQKEISGRQSRTVRSSKHRTVPNLSESMRFLDGGIEVMIVIKPITPANVSTFKAVRLRALQDTPGAFGSTYAHESQLSDADWLKRAERWNGDQGAGFLAMDGDVACGIAGCFIDEKDKATALLISMWTAPTHRQRGVGRLLVNEVLRWAAERNVTVLKLLVTCHNQPAIRFYEQLGFTRTGRTEPYPNDPVVIEYEMARAVLAAG